MLEREYEEDREKSLQISMEWQKDVGVKRQTGEMEWVEWTGGDVKLNQNQTKEKERGNGHSSDK